MYRIAYQGKQYKGHEGETVVEALVRQGLDIAFSCRMGICQVCLHKCLRGTVPQESVLGISEDLIEKGYFLPCICRPSSDIEIAPLDFNDLFNRARVVQIETLSPDIIQLSLDPSVEMAYRAGQFINLRRETGDARSYYLSSVFGEDKHLTIQVKRKMGGVLSSWLFDEVKQGDEVYLQGPNGSYRYRARTKPYPLYLIGEGVVAPLFGIAREALAAGHGGEVSLLHLGREKSDFYLTEQMKVMERNFSNFHYRPHLLPEGDARCNLANLCESVLQRGEEIRDAVICLSGGGEITDLLKQMVVELGVHSANVETMSFLYRDKRAGTVAETERKKPSSQAKDRFCRRKEDKVAREKPDPEMWAALGEGELLTAILKDFYTKAFEDPVLSPYFAGVTKERLIEKVYSFLRQIFTGERLYFGDRPRNAHHWMVISDEIFDYRERLLVGCMRRFGLAEHLIQRWVDIEETYRQDIVKSEPRGRMVGDVETPTSGFGEAVLGEGSICDGCGRGVEAGETVLYHLRIGSIYCESCRGEHCSEEQRG